MEAIPLTVVLCGGHRERAEATRGLLGYLAESGCFEPRPAPDLAALRHLPPGALALVAADVAGETVAEAREFVERGGSLLAVDAALVAEGSTAAPVTELTLGPRAGHAITARLDPETQVRDRLWLAAEPPPAAEALIEVPWRYTRQVLAYAAELGAGRVVHVGLGHEAATWSHPLFRQLVFRSLRHLAGLETVSPVTAGLIGFGAIGREHGLSIGAVEGLLLRSVCDPLPERRQSAEHEFHLTAYPDAEALLADPDLDLVVVGTPPNAHTDLVIRALEAGKHVVCEKPFALSVADCDRMIDVARRAGTVLTVYQSRRWDPDFATLRAQVRAGAIGDPFYMEAFIGGYSHPCSYWHSHEPISGGTIYDWGSHYFDWVLQLFAEPVVRVTATAHKRVWHDVTNADQVRVHLAFEGGSEATFLQSDIAAALKPKWYLLGTAGAITGDWRLEGVSSRAWTGDLVEERLAPSEAPARLAVHRPAAGAEPSRQELALPARVANGFYRNLADHLLGGEPLEVPPAQARRSVAVMEAATRSIAAGGSAIEVRV